MKLRRIAPAAALALPFVLALAGVASASAHPVKVSGTGLLKATWGVDFDAGVLNSIDEQTEDMQFDAQSATLRYLEPTGTGTRIKRMASEPSYKTCSTTSMSHHRINVKSFPAGTWFCFKTNQGRFVRFTVDHVYPDPGGMNITYTTWK
jgi:hypothetical protein